MFRSLVLTVLLLSASAYAVERCADVRRELLSPIYAELVCAGEEMGTRGDWSGAAEKFSEAAETPLHEAPNFHALLNVANAYCHVGNFVSAKKAALEFQIALEIYSGKRKCSAVVDVDEDKRDCRDDVLRSVENRMCGELLESYYVDDQLKTLERQKEIKELWRSLKSVRVFCNKQKNSPPPRVVR